MRQLNQRSCLSVTTDSTSPWSKIARRGQSRCDLCRLLSRSVDRSQRSLDRWQSTKNAGPLHFLDCRVGQPRIAPTLRPAHHCRHLFSSTINYIKRAELGHNYKSISAELHAISTMALECVALLTGLSSVSVERIGRVNYSNSAGLRIDIRKWPQSAGNIDTLPGSADAGMIGPNVQPESLTLSRTASIFLWMCRACHISQLKSLD